MNDVVLVEDDPDLCLLVTLMLSAEGYTVRAFDRGADALAACLANPPAVALLDWMMPEMTGLELLKELRANPQTAGVPVVMVTALDAPEKVRAAMQAGAQDYVTKPFSRGRMLSAVEEALQHRPGEVRHLSSVQRAAG